MGDVNLEFPLDTNKLIAFLNGLPDNWKQLAGVLRADIELYKTQRVIPQLRLEVSGTCVDARRIEPDPPFEGYFPALHNEGSKKRPSSYSSPGFAHILIGQAFPSSVEFSVYSEFQFPLARQLLINALLLGYKGAIYMHDKESHVGVNFKEVLVTPYDQLPLELALRDIPSGETLESHLSTFQIETLVEIRQKRKQAMKEGNKVVRELELNYYERSGGTYESIEPLVQLATSLGINVLEQTAKKK